MAGKKARFHTAPETDMLAAMDAPTDQRSQPRDARRETPAPRRASALSAWMAQAGRDARVLLDGLRGRHPSPLVPRRVRGVAGRDLSSEERLSQPSLPGPMPAPAPARPGNAAETVHVQIGDRAYEINVQPGQTILDAALAAALPMPFSCTVGGCGACKVECRAGIVELEEPCCLTDAEREAGHVLTCVGRPVGPVRIEVTLP
jgi:ferredoxin